MKICEIDRNRFADAVRHLRATQAIVNDKFVRETNDKRCMNIEH